MDECASGSQMENRGREMALFNLGIDSKLRGCDLVGLKVRDICHGDQVASRAMVMQHKTQRPVQFEITPATRDAVQRWIKQAGLKADDFVFPSRIHDTLRAKGTDCVSTELTHRHIAVQDDQRRLEGETSTTTSWRG
jgi:site-specific recombinase XerC